MLLATRPPPSSDSSIALQMLVAVLLYFIRASRALPTSESPGTPEPDNSADSTRTIPGIVWSCLTTIFACTWIAVHPNLPNSSERESRLANFRRRLWIFTIALIAPEYIIAWAAGQRWNAKRTLEKLHELPLCKDWTITHAFFITMGGFEVVDQSGNRLGILELPGLAILLAEDRLALPLISSADIEDKSKGDTLGKLLVLTQTTWFMAQVVSRAIQHLPITELELTTVAFASLNIIIYIQWWKKPLDVQRPFSLTLRGDVPPSLSSLWRSHTVSSLAMSVDQSSFRGTEATLPTVAGDIHFPRTISPYLNDNHPGAAHDGVDSPGQVGDRLVAVPVLSNGIPACPRDHDELLCSPAGVDTEHSSSRNLDDTSVNQCVDSAIPPAGHPTRIARATRRLSLFSPAAVWHSTSKVVSAFIRADAITEVSKKRFYDAYRRYPFLSELPTFHRGSWITGQYYQASAEILSGSLFGGIHCVAWRFDFPSQWERILWRTISLYITVAPLFLGTVHLVVWIIEQWGRRRMHRGLQRYPLLLKQFLRVLGGISSPVGVFLVILFIIARAATFICAFLLLRDLPPGTLQEVQWLKFIPHV
ncbi:hypothetical protein B0H16DRAFT_1623151 [Mycena metata]|uniref:Uncharacterized protein n=1 Tax=Mycena metata TaxID=1033252 RepID=A0AAD7ME36_9AGAR|nr:hypothetical protein B0H16DRAFT_1623151 [Mycena metata]